MNYHHLRSPVFFFPEIVTLTILFPEPDHNRTTLGYTTIPFLLSGFGTGLTAGRKSLDLGRSHQLAAALFHQGQGGAAFGFVQVVRGVPHQPHLKAAMLG